MIVRLCTIMQIKLHISTLPLGEKMTRKQLSYKYFCQSMFLILTIYSLCNTKFSVLCLMLLMFVIFVVLLTVCVPHLYNLTLLYTVGFSNLFLIFTVLITCSDILGLFSLIRNISHGEY